MRDLIFRAWYEGEMKGAMITDDHLICVWDDNKGGSVIIGNACGNYGSSLLEKCSTPVMQYTGIKDKDGVEIFECDVVTQPRIPYLDGYVGVIEYINHLCAFKIVLQGKYGNVNAKIMQHMKADQDSMQDDCLQVIGNIYENPELLGEL